jgi:two-component system, OmpR family, phosphate regulon sensor histidine kinase PhoR
MSIAAVQRLGDLIQLERKALVDEWRRRVMELPSAQELDAPTIIDHIPDLLDELAEALQSRRDESIPEVLMNGTPPRHGIQRLRDGFDIAEVVAEYNILRGCIHDLAEQNGMTIRGKTFHILNRVLDEAIGLSVQTYATERALEVQQKREEYLAFVAHDLRTPLNAISLSAQALRVLLDASAMRPDISQVLTSLQRNVTTMADLIGGVLQDNAHSPHGAGIKIERRVIDFWPIVEAVLSDLRPIADTNSTEMSNEVPVELTVYADAGMLTRIMQNLVSNAIRYTPRGRVTVGARAAGADGMVECWVVDNGAGISPDMIGRVFEKFETDGDHEESTGLGLAIVKEFVEAHGGTVQVESEQKVQTAFRFTLPGASAARRKG